TLQIRRLRRVLSRFFEQETREESGRSQREPPRRRLMSLKGLDATGPVLQQSVGRRDPCNHMNRTERPPQSVISNRGLGQSGEERLWWRCRARHGPVAENRDDWSVM